MNWGEDPVWISCAENILRRPISQIGLRARLVEEITASIARTGHPPILKNLMWSLRMRVGAIEQRERRREIFHVIDAFDRINGLVFQTLQRDDLFRSMLSASGLTASRIPTQIWTDWCGVQQACPVEAARGWLNRQHWDHGLGPLFGAHDAPAHCQADNVDWSTHLRAVGTK